MRVFLTGGTGYVGRAVLSTLIASGHEVVAVVRKPQSYTHASITWVQGDVLDPQSILDGMEGCDAVIHLVGIIREHPSTGVTFDKIHVEATRNIVASCKVKGISRYLHMSALGARKGSLSAYQHSKALAEETVMSSDLDWTIFRPSVIFGPGDEFVNTLAQAIRYTPIFPVFGNGQYKLQPIALQNVADSFVQALSRDNTSRRRYDVGGPLSYTYDNLLQEIGEAIGKKKTRLIHVPVSIVSPVVQALQGLSFFPITYPQLLMLLESNTCDPSRFYQTFDLTPINFEEGIRRYLK